MKTTAIVGIFIAAILLAYSYISFNEKETVIQTIRNSESKITSFSKWGYDASTFQKMHSSLVGEVRATHPLFILFNKDAFHKKNDSIVRLVQQGYATEVAKEKNEVQIRLTYLRDRVKNTTYIPVSKKQAYFDSFEVVAGTVFENPSSLSQVKEALVTLSKTDKEITQEVEKVRKESLMGELAQYKSHCEELLSFFVSKQSQKNQEIALTCISAADKLMGPGYTGNGADFIETLSRERVFSAYQNAQKAKQQLIQEEQYALLQKKREEERLTVVPPAPRQEGKIIVVNIALQRLYAYENGATLFATAVPITTGKNGFETVLGEFAIYLKEVQHRMTSPFPGIYYDDVVNYWMPFYLGYGLHDAPWRSVYGTQDYGAVGSHGCVNMPLNEASILYNWAEVGTRVFVL